MPPFFEPAREPKLKAPFIRRSGLQADNQAVKLFQTASPVRSRRPTAPTVGSRLASAWVALCLGLMCAASAWAGDERDHERARAAVQAGEVLPLPALLEKLRRTHPGQVMELELERERDGGRWVYEVKLLQPDGGLLKLDIDAATGQVLQARRRPDRDKSRQGERQKEPLK